MSAAPLAAAQVAAYLSRIWGTPVSIDALARIPGGASRETYRFDATADGKLHQLILRRDPGASLIDTESETEFRAYQSAWGTVPVPHAVALEAAGAELERPFFIMERVEGGEVASAFARAPFGDHGEALGAAFFTALGKLAALDPANTPLGQHLPTPAPDEAWRIALDYWEGVLDEDQQRPLPVARAAIRRLRANPPPPAQKLSLVHGDYRTGNFLYDDAGGIHGILDWEMAHLGDPLEDLGWSLNPVWSFGTGIAGGLLPRDEAIAIWERASGLKADPAALHWWELFNCVKGQAIWVSSARAWLDGGNREPIMVYPPWALQNAQDRAALKVMGRL